MAFRLPQPQRPGRLGRPQRFRVVARSPLGGLSVLDARVGAEIKWDRRLWESMYPLKVTGVSFASEKMAPRNNVLFRDLILTREYTKDDVDKKVDRPQGCSLEEILFA
jgi:hypothetical protein